MPLSKSQRLDQLHNDMRELASATGARGWDKDPDEILLNPSDLGAKPIPLNEWMRALLIAGQLSEASPQAGMPVPGADPEGFVWLTWTQGDCRGIALELRKGKYRWTQRSGEAKQTIESDSLNDVAESMRTVFLREHN